MINSYSMYSKNTAKRRSKKLMLAFSQEKYDESSIALLLFLQFDLLL